jgi:hypothetical protein
MDKISRQPLVGFRRSFRLFCSASNFLNNCQRWKIHKTYGKQDTATTFWYLRVSFACDFQEVTRFSHRSHTSYVDTIYLQPLVGFWSSFRLFCSALSFPNNCQRWKIHKTYGKRYTATTFWYLHVSSACDFQEVTHFSHPSHTSYMDKISRQPLVGFRRSFRLFCSALSFPNNCQREEIHKTYGKRYTATSFFVLRLVHGKGQQ